jgi:hypothetical protein
MKFFIGVFGMKILFHCSQHTDGIGNDSGAGKGSGRWSFGRKLYNLLSTVIILKGIGD